MTNEATNKIELMIEQTMERAKQAENRFDMSTDLIQRKASHSIDLFAGSAVSQVSDIAAESRRACDDLYASYQSLIVSLDEYCRPLLAEKPDASAVKNIAELMRWLNDESEIENNFTASLNGSSLGGVASGRYFASVECKMIQRYWEDKYHDMPEVIETEEKNRKTETVRRAEIEEKYPLPVKPSEPRKTKEIRSHVSRDGMTAVQIANECIKDEILDFLSDGTMYTIPEMQEQCFTLGELSNQRVSALVRQLMTEGKVERIEYKRQAYFKLI